jgi:hypothetical protein
MARQSEEFYPRGARRLILAVVNQAISDVLEKNGDAKAAEQWLLSREFDNLVEMLGCDTEVFGYTQQQYVA